MYKYKNKEYDFIFTIFDDTDNSTIENIKPVYNYLYKNKIFITKSVWSKEVKNGNNFTGDSLENEDYLNFILELKKKGFEIALHNVGSGQFVREEIIEGVEKYKELIDEYPNIHVNHSSNSDNIYWGGVRFMFPFNYIYTFFNKKRYYGEIEDSPFFWGDIVKKHIKYVRSHTFYDINTIKSDPYMPYIENSKSKYSNFWFSSTDALDITNFNTMVSPNNIDKLIDENGISIIYTHFASGFVKDGQLDKEFKKNIEYLSSKNGLFIPISKLLDFLLEKKYYKNLTISNFEKFKLDFRFFYQRVMRKL
ncbi:MAG: hypothetical protein JJV94_01795 [Sulfurospirillum sp.]|nr:hypothetical protein [Sulfurospirillum sp.]